MGGYDLHQKSVICYLKYIAGTFMFYNRKQVLHKSIIKLVCMCNVNILYFLIVFVVVCHRRQTTLSGKVYPYTPRTVFESECYYVYNRVCKYAYTKHCCRYVFNRNCLYVTYFFIMLYLSVIRVVSIVLKTIKQ